MLFYIYKWEHQMVFLDASKITDKSTVVELSAWSVNC